MQKRHRFKQRPTLQDGLGPRALKRMPKGFQLAARGRIRWPGGFFVNDR